MSELEKRNNADWNKFFETMLPNFAEISEVEILNLQKELQNIVQGFAYNRQVAASSTDEDCCIVEAPVSPPRKKIKLSPKETKPYLGNSNNNFIKSEWSPPPIEKQQQHQKQHVIHHSQYVPYVTMPSVQLPSRSPYYMPYAPMSLAPQYNTYPYGYGSTQAYSYMPPPLSPHQQVMQYPGSNSGNLMPPVNSTSMQHPGYPHHPHANGNQAPEQQQQYDPATKNQSSG